MNLRRMKVRDVYGAAILFATFFGPEVGASGPLSLSDLRQNFEVSGEVFVVDSANHQIQSKWGQTYLWRSRTERGPQIDHQWFGSVGEIKFAIRQIWEIKDDRSIHLTIEQYEHVDEQGEKAKYAGLIKKEEHLIEDFAPVQFVITPKTGDSRLVLRLTPELTDERPLTNVSGLALGATDAMIYDTDGSVWSEHASFDGKYIGLKSHRGTVWISYSPFEGGHELGSVEGKMLQLRIGQNKLITIRSQTDFLPAGTRARIFGIFEPERRNPRPNMLSVIDTDDEHIFIRHLKE